MTFREKNSVDNFNTNFKVNQPYSYNGVLQYRTIGLLRLRFLMNVCVYVSA